MLLLIDKPKGITSHDVIDVVRIVTGEKRVGHAGTLDPNATGLLIVAVGKEDTPKLGDLTKNTRKTYIAEIVFGEERDTDDSEGKITHVDKKLKTISVEQVVETLKKFTGSIDQLPPQYSAIKQNGKKAYELARAGKQAELKSREVVVYKAELLENSFPSVFVEFEVSSGTYIRSLARDIGKALGTFAYLNNLRRTKIGEYSIEDSVALEDYFNSK